MAAIAPISVNDGKTPTAEAHVFNPIQSVPPMYRRNGVSGQALIAQERLAFKVVMPKTQSGVSRVQLTLVLPVSEIPAGNTGAGYTAPPAVAFENTVKVEFLLPARSDVSNRKDLRVLLSNLLLNPQVIAMVDSLEAPY